MGVSPTGHRDLGRREDRAPVSPLIPGPEAEKPELEEKAAVGEVGVHLKKEKPLERRKKPKQEKKEGNWERVKYVEGKELAAEEESPARKKKKAKWLKFKARMGARRKEKKEKGVSPPAQKKGGGAGHDKGREKGKKKGKEKGRGKGRGKPGKDRRPRFVRFPTRNWW